MKRPAKSTTGALITGDKAGKLHRSIPLKPLMVELFRAAGLEHFLLSSPDGMRLLVSEDDLRAYLDAEYTVYDDLIVEHTAYNGLNDLVYIMGRMAEYYAIARGAFEKGLSVAEFKEAVEEKLAAKAETAARETTARAEAKPRAKKSASPELTAIRLAAAFEALKRSSDLDNSKLSAAERRRRAKHLVTTYERLREHDPAVEDDSGVVGRARSIVNDANYQRRKKAKKAAKAATMG